MMPAGGLDIRARSIRARLTASLGVIALIVFAVAGGALYLALANELERADRNELHGKEMLISHYIEETSTDGNLSDLKHHIDDALMAHSDLRVWLLSERGEVIVGAGKLPRQYDRSGEFLALRTDDGVSLEGVRRPIMNPGTLPLASMLVTVDVGPRLRLLQNYRRMLWLVCTCGVVAIILLSAWATDRGLMPVRRLSKQAARISPASLSLRLDTRDIDSELEDLVLGFNEALDRVEAAYRKVESFNADVAHELRTPLATLINAAQVTLADQRSPEALRETLVDQLEELEQLKGLVNDMLFLARADQGDQAPDARRVKLSDEIRKTVEYYEALLSDANLSVDIEGEVVLHCNAGLIRRALSNLLSNAIEHTEAGQTIRFRLLTEQGFGTVEVFNPGTPMPDEIRSRMFDRFFRADPARSRRDASHGLGLAIVRAIAEMHRGQVFARSGVNGNTIGFRIPVSRSSGPLIPGGIEQGTAAATDSVSPAEFDASR